MNNQKHWYEKVSIWIGIIASVVTIVVGAITIVNNFRDNKNDGKNINNFDENTITSNDGDIIINLGDNNDFTKKSYNENKFEEGNININNLELKYATLSDDRFKNVYIGEYTDLSISKEKYYLENNCAFILNISNPTDHQIKVNKFRIVANNIIQICEPSFDVFLCMFESGVEFFVTNNGWDDAYDIELIIDDKDQILSKYFNKEDLYIKIASLKAGESIDIFFPKVDKYVTIPNENEYEYISIRPIIQIKTDSKVSIFDKFLPIYLYNDKILIDEIGGNEEFYGVYGITVNSNLSTFQKEFNVNETINVGEILDIPICFFPNKSSSMEFHVEFDIFDGFSEETVSSDIRKIEFSIPSTGTQYVNFDNCTVDVQEIYNNTESRYYISYPDSKELNPLNSHQFINYE